MKGLLIGRPLTLALWVNPAKELPTTLEEVFITGTGFPTLLPKTKLKHLGKIMRVLVLPMTQKETLLYHQNNTKVGYLTKTLAVLTLPYHIQKMGNFISGTKKQPLGWR